MLRLPVQCTGCRALAWKSIFGGPPRRRDSTARQVLRDVYKLAGSAAAPMGSAGQVRAKRVSAPQLGRYDLCRSQRLLLQAWLDSKRRAVAHHAAAAAAASYAAPPHPPRQVDLSDGTMARLQQKLDALANLKAQRCAHASELMAILHSLWDACGVPADAPERVALARLMGGPLRLHTRSLEKCMAEVRRCEEAKVAQMLEIVNDKAR